VLTIGFDLDLTLVDSRPGIAATFRALGAADGVRIDVDAVVRRIGPPLEHELAHWYPADEVPAAVDRYRALYRRHAITPSPALPGAAEALAGVRAAGGTAVVVTAKKGDLAWLHLRHLGLAPAEVYGLAWADGKAAALRRAGALAFVGDHVADMAAARTAGVLAIGVPTGPCSPAELTGAGAEVVLRDLRDFPAWLTQIRVGHEVSGS
jgi:phosphoglycolate phosphatase